MRIVVDCGDGVARQLVLAGIPLARIRHVFLTHQHSDHNADYGNLLLLAWTAGLRTRVDAWGPPPLVTMTEHFFAMNAYDIETRIADEGRAAARAAGDRATNSPRAAGRSATRTSRSRPRSSITRRWCRPSVIASTRRIVRSSYRATRGPRDNLVDLARDADVLVHDAVFPSAVDRLVANVPNASRLEGEHPFSPHVGGRRGPHRAGRTREATRLVPSRYV